jgi:streptogramin lyase
MKMRRSLFPSAPLAVALAIGGALCWTAPAAAQTTAAGTAAVSVSTTSLSASTTVATSTSSTTTTTITGASVPVAGIVTGGPESVAFSGQAKLSASVVTDPDFGGVPTVVLTIDLSSLKGVGQSTGAIYATSDQAIVQRRLTAADTVQYSFPFNRSGTSALAPSLGLASFNLSFNVNTLKLTGVSGNIGSP